MDLHRRLLPYLLSSRNRSGQVQGLPVPMACSSQGGHLFLGLSLRLEGSPTYHLTPARRVSLRA
jgi:hypothetical protein